MYTLTFNLVHVPFMTYTSSSHQGANEMNWLHLQGAAMSSIFTFNLWVNFINSQFSVGSGGASINVASDFIFPIKRLLQCHFECSIPLLHFTYCRLSVTWCTRCTVTRAQVFTVLRPTAQAANDLRFVGGVRVSDSFISCDRLGSVHPRKTVPQL